MPFIARACTKCCAAVQKCRTRCLQTSQALPDIFLNGKTATIMLLNFFKEPHTRTTYVYRNICVHMKYTDPRTISTKSMTVVSSLVRNGIHWVENTGNFSWICDVWIFFKKFFKDGCYPKHSTWTTRNNFKSPAPRMFLPSQRRKEAQIFSWDLLQHTHFSLPLQTPWSMIKVTSTSQIHTTDALPELPFMVCDGWQTTVLQLAWRHCRARSSLKQIVKIV